MADPTPEKNVDPLDWLEHAEEIGKAIIKAAREEKRYWERMRRYG